MSWPLVSAVIIGYRRPALLEQTVLSLRARCDYPNLEVVLSDDASPPEMQAQMRRLPIDRFVFATRNQGLGANANKGLRAARGEYILQLQDDWVCQGPDDFLRASVDALRGDPSLGLVRYTHLDLFERYEVRALPSGHTLRVYAWEQQRPEVTRCLYTDCPHLKPRAFHETLGYYLEGTRMELTELDFCDRYLRQRGFGSASLEGYAVFSHEGRLQSHRRGGWKERVANVLSRNAAGRRLLDRYRALRSG